MGRLKSMLVHSAKQHGEDPKKAEEIIEEITRELSEDKGESITKANFVNKGKTNPKFVEYIVPDLLTIQMSIDTMGWEKELLDEATSELFMLLQVGAHDQSSISAALLDADTNAKDVNQNSLLHASAKSNCLIVVEKIIQKHPELINQMNKDGETPLMLAVERGHEKVTRLLLSKGANPNLQDVGGGTALHRAFKQKEQVRGVGLIHSIRQLLECPTLDLTIETKHQNTPLDFAARFNHPDLIPDLVHRGAKVNHKGHSDYTPMHWAANSGLTQCLHRLKDAGGDMHACSLTGVNLAHLAAGAGEFNCLELLKGCGVNLKATDAIGRTPLHFAAANGSARCVKFLILEAPEVLELPDHQGKTPFQIASANGKKEAAAIISNGPLQVQSDFSIKLLKHFRNGENDIVKKMLSKEASDVHVANENGTTLVHYSAMQGRGDILTLILDRGADPNIGNNRLTRPLHKAIQRGDLGCTKILLSRGANPDVQDVDGVTPIHRGLKEIQTGKRVSHVSQCILECLSHKPKLSLAENRGLKPFDLVALYGLVDLVDPFLKAGADISATHPETGWAPIHYAISAGRNKMIEKLLKEKSDLLQVSHISSTDVAIQHGQASTLELLLGKNQTLSLDALCLAAATGDLVISEKVVEQIERKHINHRDNNGNNALHCAKSPEVAQKLIQWGVYYITKNNNKYGQF